MKEKVLKFVKKNLLSFIIGFTITISTVVLASNTISSSSISFDNTNVSAYTSSTKVSTALDELYTLYNNRTSSKTCGVGTYISESTCYACPNQYTSDGGNGDIYACYTTLPDSNTQVDEYGNFSSCDINYENSYSTEERIYYGTAVYCDVYNNPEIENCLYNGGTWDYAVSSCNYYGGGGTTDEEACSLSGGSWNSTSMICETPETQCVNDGGTWDYESSICNYYGGGSTETCIAGYYYSWDSMGCVMCPDGMTSNDGATSSSECYFPW